MRPESSRKLLFVFVELLPQQNILIRVHAINERDLGIVAWVAQHAPNQLVGRRDALSSRDETDVRMFVGLPGVAWYGAAERHCVARFEVVEVSAGFAIGVLFD